MFLFIIKMKLRNFIIAWKPISQVEEYSNSTSIKKPKKIIKRQREVEQIFTNSNLVVMPNTLIIKFKCFKKNWTNVLINLEMCKKGWFFFNYDLCICLNHGWTFSLSMIFHVQCVFMRKWLWWYEFNLVSNLIIASLKCIYNDYMCFWSWKKETFVWTCVSLSQGMLMMRNMYKFCLDEEL